MKITFKNKTQDTLTGNIHPIAAKSAKHFALFAHCFSCSKDLAVATFITRALAEYNIAVFRFDFTGLGASDGVFEKTNFTHNIEDLLCAADYLAKHYAPADLLIGHSLGGATVLAAANQLDSVKGIVTLGAPSTPTHLEHLFMHHEKTILEKGSAQINIAGKLITIEKQFVEDLKKHDLATSIKQLSKALLIFHSPIDSIVPIEEAAKIFAQAKHPKSFISLDNADHLLSNPDDAKYVGHLIATWANRYL